MAEKIAYRHPETHAKSPAEALELNQGERRKMLAYSLLGVGLTVAGVVALVKGLPVSVGGISVITGGVIAVAAMHYRYLNSKNQAKK